MSDTFANLLQTSMQNQVSNNSTFGRMRQAAAERLTNAPAFGQFVQNITQPVNAGLLSSVENATNANIAGNGLATSSMNPFIMAQALGPLFQQNQQQAMSTAQGNLADMANLLPIDYLTGGATANDPYSQLYSGLGGLFGSSGGLGNLFGNLFGSGGGSTGSTS